MATYIDGIKQASAIFSDSELSIFNASDNTKIIKLDAQDITTGNTRTFKVPDNDGTFVTLETSDQTFTGNMMVQGNLTLTGTTTTFTPNVDSTTAFQIFKADGTTDMMTLDTTNTSVILNSELNVTGGNILINSNDINTAGTLTNVAYLDQVNNFTQNQAFGNADGNYAIELSADGNDSTKSTITTILYSDSASILDCGYVNVGRTRGTKASPDFLNTNDSIGIYGFSVYNGASLSLQQALLGTATENHSSGNLGTELSFWTTNNGAGLPTKKITVSNDGNLNLESGTYQIGGTDINTGGTLNNVAYLDQANTFSQFPVTPSSAPTTDYQVSNKKYVDDAVSGSGSLPSGVQGDILYHSGSAWVVLNAGTDGYFLKTQGSGANPIWADAGGGGGGSSLFDATVGATGADYTTLGAAISDSKTRIALIDNTTETGNVTLPSNFYIQGFGDKGSPNINMGSYSFLDNSGANTGFTFKDLKITFAHSGTPLMDGLDELTIENVYVDNNSTASGSEFYDDGGSSKTLIFKNLTLDLPNYSSSGLSLGNTTYNKKNIVENLTIIGGGSSCDLCLDIDGGQIFNNIFFTGNFSTSSSGLINSYEAIFNNIYYFGTTVDVYFVFYRNNTVNNIYCDDGAGDLNIEISDTNNILSNINLNEASSTILISGNDNKLSNFFCNSGSVDVSADKNQISNGLMTGSFTVQSSADNNCFTNVRMQSSATISGNCNGFTNCDFEDGVTIDGDYNSITGSKAGNDYSGGTSETITISSGATGNIVIGNRVDSAIVDNGTSSVVANNSVY